MLLKLADDLYIQESEIQSINKVDKGTAYTVYPEEVVISLTNGKMWYLNPNGKTLEEFMSNIQAVYFEKPQATVA